MSVEERLEALEKGAEYKATSAEVQKVQADFLVQLREIRAALAKQDGNVASTKEVEELKKENVKLKAQMGKMDYRISHMVSSMETLLNENKELKSKQ
eukprot:CAMPEP_0198144592 /NCGR_PEP_ID=MMETSP1443-20131203/16766_1 /TAXON_ID=186043 /ORGANISM="Entomoneis sp., Strain CCMP2396" /LENGTH=96 /DNA_ID=CAMNT_0043808005 /DNA_START=111 /DNA_END=401 /DNA_ORIENTATION=-